MSRFVNYTTRYYYVDEFDEDLKNSFISRCKEMEEFFPWSRNAKLEAV